MENKKQRISLTLEQETINRLDYLIGIYDEEFKGLGVPANFTKSLAIERLINTAWNDTPAGKESAEKMKEKIKEYNKKFEGDDE